MFNVEDILDRVRETDEDRSGYNKAASKWEEMWELKVHNKTPEQALDEDGQELVTLPTPYNVVHLARRLISQDPRIEVPSTSIDSDESLSASRRERFLSAFWQRANKERGRIVVGDATWQALVRGRYVLEVTWVKDALPKRLKEQRLPIMVRTLDPMNVGIKRGQLWTDYAYHRYRDRRSNVRQRYPELDLSQPKREGPLSFRDDVEVIDFWWTDQSDGSIWHAVLVDKKFAIEPVQTDYPDIPIIEGYGDSAPIGKEELSSLSILYPINGTWQYACRLASQIGTGLLWAFWPAILVSNQDGVEIPDFEVKPGTTTHVPVGTNVNVVRSDVNLPLANNMVQMVEKMTQESTFPGVMYGDAGNMQAGYGVSILSDAARGRVSLFRKNLESGIEQANALILGLVETFGGKDGVTVWAKSEKTGEIFKETLKPSDIDGNYENLVTLTPQIPSDDIQKQTIGMRMVQERIMSKKTYRDRFANFTFPDDEGTRVEIEKALDDPTFAAKNALKAFQDTYPETWEKLVVGTPLEEEAKKQGLIVEPMPEFVPQWNAQQQLLPDLTGMPPQMPIQPDGLMGNTGVPPEMQGQLTPELMGLGPDVDPLLWAQITGQPMSPQEELDQLSGLY